MNVITVDYCILSPGCSTGINVGLQVISKNVYNQ